jgi:hypothetical protein
VKTRTAAKKTLVGLDEKLFDEADDLIALTPAQGQKSLSQLLQRYGFFFKEDHRDLPPSWGGITYFPEKRIHHIVTAVSTALAAILLVGAIVSLYVAKSQIARLGMICGFTTAFAASLGLLTRASQAEVFAATAARVFLDAPVLVMTCTNAKPFDLDMRLSSSCL